MLRWRDIICQDLKDLGISESEWYSTSKLRTGIAGKPYITNGLQTNATNNN